jgi:hypothetical protein
VLLEMPRAVEAGHRRLPDHAADATYLHRRRHARAHRMDPVHPREETVMAKKKMKPKPKPKPKGY